MRYHFIQMENSFIYPFYATYTTLQTAAEPAVRAAVQT